MSSLSITTTAGGEADKVYTTSRLAVSNNCIADTPRLTPVLAADSIAAGREPSLHATASGGEGSRSAANSPSTFPRMSPRVLRKINAVKLGMSFVNNLKLGD